MVHEHFGIPCPWCTRRRKPDRTREQFLAILQERRRKRIARAWARVERDERENRTQGDTDS